MLGEKLTTWRFKSGKLLNRINHKIEFNEKNEAHVKTAYAVLNEISNETNYNPKTLMQIANRANARFILGNYTLALRDFLQIEKIGDKKGIPIKLKSSIYDKIGSIYASLEMSNRAIHYKFKTVKTSPDEARLKYNLAAGLFEINAYRLSIIYLKEVKKTWPNHAFSNWLLAAMYSDFDDNEKAMEFINMAFKREKNLIKFGSGDAERDIRTIRGLLYHKLGDSEKGIADLTEALNINKNNSFALRNLGVIYHDLGQFDKSCALLQKTKELGYEKIHDRNNLQYFLDTSCNQKTESKLEKLSEQPYIYPNPVENILNVKNYNQENFEFELYNFESKLVEKGISNQSSINISALESGLYILKIVDRESILALKSLKNK